MLAIDFFGLGQNTAPTASAAPVVQTQTHVTLPAVPDDAVVRCKFDQAINGFRCSPVGLFEPPTVFLLVAASVALLGLGYAFGRTRFLPRAVESFVAEPPRLRR
jgi:hypothetical protein